MRHRSVLSLGIVLSCTVGLALYGCSAGSNPLIDDPDSGAAQGQDASASGDDDATAAIDPGSPADSGHDAAHDAGSDAHLHPDTGAPGTPCGPVGQNESQSCGRCGTQARVCLVGEAGSDAGPKPGLWSDWGACTGEVTGKDSCDPSVADAGTEPCGNCGYRPILCQMDCHVAQGIVCQGEPANSCSPNDTKFTLAQGCSANMGRAQVCGTSCTWGPPSGCEAPPVNPNHVTLSNTSGTTVSGTFALGSKTMPTLDTGSCPAGMTSGGTSRATFIEIFNNDTKAHIVDVWTTKVTVVQDNIIAWYNTPIVPSSDTDQTACTGNVNDGCSSTRALTPACGGTNFGGLVDGDAPTVPAGGAIEVYVGGYDSSTPAGNFTFSVRTR